MRIDVRKLTRKLGGYVSVLVLFVISMVLQAVPVRAVDCIGYTNGAEWVISSTQSGCTIPAGTYTPSSFIVDAGATVYAQGDTGAGTGVTINVSGDLEINGTLSADGKGYAGNSGPGVGSGGTQRAGGSAYGGDGADSGGTAGGTGGYGSVSEPTSLGSGGGRDNYWAQDGGPGGGAIRLVVSGTATIAGELTADGNPTPAWGAGAGSGGSVWVTAATLTGNGIITATGGLGSGNGGSGGGGRIALNYGANTFTGSVTAYGGAGTYKGGAGTVYRKADSATYGNLTIDNNGMTVEYTRQSASGATTFNTLTIRNGAKYVILSGQTTSLETSVGTLDAGSSAQPSIIINSGGTFDPGISSFTFSGIDVTNNGDLATVSNLTVGSDSTFSQDSSATFLGGTGLTSLTVGDSGSGTMSFSGTSQVTIPTVVIAPGGLLTHASNTSSKVNELNLAITNLDVQSGATVSASGKGYAGNNGPGVGSGGTQRAGGSAYGGDGGDSGATAGGIGGYGSVSEPTSLGSGGGRDNYYAVDGGPGGGAIRLSVSGTATISGAISSDGYPTPSVGAGAGSGGSIWITAGTLSGSGTITATGGLGSGNGGSGGGGRIALYYGTGVFSGTATAYGGAGTYKGGAGTVYTKEDAVSFGDLTIDNNDIVGDYTRQAISGADTFSVLTIQNGSKYLIAGILLTKCC